MKRLFDIAVSLLVLLAALPLLVIMSLLVSIMLGGNPFFRQLRPGLNGVPFNMIKFRSMRNAYDSHGNPLPDSERLTRFGRVLRATSLDELPELWNVVKGDMSLVGPRPLLMEYLPLYNERQMRRHKVRPGITGWAQVNGRNAISWDQKFDLDLYYVENQSLWFDLKILFLTIKKAFEREGITSDKSVTMEKFKGNNRDRKKENTRHNRS